jgi:hypothetical protein
MSANVLENLMVAAILVLGVIYLILGLVAFGHVGSDDKRERMAALSPWWAFYSDLYNESGRKLCTGGKIVFGVFLVISIVYVAQNGL